MSITHSSAMIFSKFSSLDIKIEPCSNTFIAEPTISFPFLLNFILLWQICFHVCLKLSSFIWKSRLRPFSHSFFPPSSPISFSNFPGTIKIARNESYSRRLQKNLSDLRTRTATPDAQQTFSHHRPFSAKTLI